MLPAWLFAFSHVITDILFVKYAGDGRHVIGVSADKIIIWLKLTTVESFTYVPSTTLPKLAILVLYRQIFVTKWHRNISNLIIGIMFLNWIVSLVLNIVICMPFAYAWNKTIVGGHCMNQMQLYIWFSLPNLLTDLAILILPLPAIWRLQMSKNQKIGVTITLLTGSFGIITAIVRLIVFITIDVFEDITWHGIEIMVWTTIEPGVYLIAACLPSLRSLIKDLSKFLSIESIGTFFNTTRPQRSATEGEAYSLSKGTVADQGFKRLRDPTMSTGFGYETGDKGFATATSTVGKSGSSDDLETGYSMGTIRTQKSYGVYSETESVARLQ